MKLALDFDGVCTDLNNKQVPVEKDAREKYLADPEHIIHSLPRHGLTEIISVFGLFGNIEIISSRPPEHEPYILQWLKYNKIDSFISYITCCDDESKVSVMELRGLDLLVDDSVCHVQGLFNTSRGLLWSTQSWLAILIEALNIFCKKQIASLKSDKNFILNSFKCVSNWGASPVLILSDLNGIKKKLRICVDMETRDRIVSFLLIANDGRFPHVAQLLDFYGLAVLKSYITGTPLMFCDNSLRHCFIKKVAIALAKLHDNFKTRIELKNIFLPLLKEEQNCLLICGADNRNTIITSDNNVVFIDLEACNYGSRWVDIAWSEELLCKNKKEREILINSYLSASKISLPSSKGKKLSELWFLKWLFAQLQKSIMIHNKNNELYHYYKYIKKKIENFKIR